MQVSRKHVVFGEVTSGMEVSETRAGADYRRCLRLRSLEARLGIWRRRLSLRIVGLYMGLNDFREMCSARMCQLCKLISYPSSDTPRSRERTICFYDVYAAWRVYPIIYCPVRSNHLIMLIFSNIHIFLPAHSLPSIRSISILRPHTDLDSSRPTYIPLTCKIQHVQTRSLSRREEG
jgi:hypothetical protein